jgi:hypothetical protein
VGVRLLAIIFFFASAGEAQIPVTLHLFNTASVPTEVLAAAKQETSWLLRAAGVEPSWTDCPPPRMNGDAPCQHLPPGGFVIGIRSEHAWDSSHRVALGFALLFDGRGDRALIDYSRVTAAATRWGIPIQVLLGHAIAHELGHLLLHSEAHGPGLMQPTWTQGDAKRILRHKVLFSAEQIARIHTVQAHARDLQK